MPTMIPKHFSEMIIEEFQKRAYNNSAYSLRAFARDLNFSAGTLSDIMQKKTGLSPEKSHETATKLGLQGEEKDFFCKLVEANCARKLEDREKAEKELFKYNTRYTEIKDDIYRVIADWYHFALVELVCLSDFQNDNAWIAKRLGISPEEAREAITRLLNVKLLEEREGKLYQTYDYFVSPRGTPLEEAKKFHNKVLSMAVDALYTQEIPDKDYTTGFLRFRRSDLPKVFDKIKTFRRELVKEMEEGSGHDSVYAFAIQFFRADIDTGS